MTTSGEEDKAKGDDKGDGGDPQPEPKPSAETVSTSALNQQIVQAVDKTNQVVLGAAATEANGVAYQKVAQAAAFSVQDSTDYLRNIMTIAATAQGVCLQKMISTEEVEPYAQIMQKAQEAVTAAQTNFAAVGTSSASVASGFPNS